VVERLTGHRSRREKRGGANTTGTVTIQNLTPVGVMRRTEPGSTNPPSFRDGTWGSTSIRWFSRRHELFDHSRVL
jgi:hypothetical protein